MRRIKYAVGVLLLAFSAGFGGAMAIGKGDAAPPENTAVEHCATDLTSPAHYSTTRRRRT